MQNAVQKYLLQGNSLEQLQEQYGINIHRHSKYPNLISFKYSQIDSPMKEEIVQHARGLILDEANNWLVVAWPMNKFFNYGEGHAAIIDWTKASVQEKVDGSLIPVYYYDAQWHAATSGTPDAGRKVHSHNITFADYFWQTMGKYPSMLNLFKQNSINPYITFCFELMGPLNRIVVVYPETKLALLSARNNLTGEEFSTQEANLLFLKGTAPCVKEFKLTSTEEIWNSFQFISPLSQEGYVVYDGKNRIKIKSPAYVALHHAKDGMTSKAFLETIRNGEVSEFLTAFPEFLPLMEEAERRYQQFLAELEADYDRLKNIPTQKDFALEAVKTRCSGALFAVRSHKTPDIKTFIRQMMIDKLLEHLGY